MMLKNALFLFPMLSCTIVNHCINGGGGRFGQLQNVELKYLQCIPILVIIILQLYYTYIRSGQVPGTQALD